jgi:hypothetical protein
VAHFSGTDTTLIGLGFDSKLRKRKVEKQANKPWNGANLKGKYVIILFYLFDDNIMACKGMDWLQQNHYRAPWVWQRCASHAVLTQLFMYCLVSSVNTSFVYVINYINTKEGYKIYKNSFVNNAAASLRLYPGISAEFHRTADKLAFSPERQGWSLGFIQSPTPWLAYVLSKEVKMREPEADRSPTPVLK